MGKVTPLIILALCMLQCDETVFSSIKLYTRRILTGGIKTTVPPFITTDDFVVISTADSNYIEKVKK